MNHQADQVATRGPWFLNDEGVPVIKRQLFDEHGDHVGYELLDGDYGAVAHLLERAEELVKALRAIKAKCVEPAKNEGQLAALVLSIEDIARAALAKVPTP